MGTHWGLKAGGISTTPTQNVDIMPALITQEGVDFIGIKEITIIPTANLNIKINGGSNIPLLANIAYVNTSTLITKLVFDTAVLVRIYFNY